MRRYYAGDDSVLTMLYNKNTGLIRSIAKETAAMYGCVMMDDKHPSKYSSISMPWRRDMPFFLKPTVENSFLLQTQKSPLDQ